MLPVFIFNIIVIAIVVIIHYEFLYQFTNIMPKLKVLHRLRILLGVFAALAAHSVEVWVFGLAYYLMQHAERFGHFHGNFEGTFLDCVYFSFTTYTTLGTGDIEPIGNLRYLTGLEALTGLVLITWSASFLYLEMTRYWDRD